MTTIETLNQWYADGESIIDDLSVVDTKPSVFHWPTDHHYITRDYGARPDVYKGQIPKRLYHPLHWHDGHEGVDIRTGKAGNVYAIAPGKVEQVGERSPGHPYGYAMRIQHLVGIGSKPQLIRSVYAHLKTDSNVWNVGDEVGGGEELATADSTGNSTGDHLHLTLYWWFDSLQGYRIVNPMWVLNL